MPVDRPVMTQRPRIILYHTNGGPNRSTLAGQRNWAMASADNTKPHYQVGLEPSDGTEKTLASHLRGIGNGTVTSTHSDWGSLSSEQRAEITEHGRAAEFSLVIETLDLGTNNGIGGATDYQGEMVARIFAYESIVWQFPLVEPTEWFGAGCSCHTLPPGGYPFWTNALGKTCPGDQKKQDFRAWVLPRAIEIRARWLGEEGELASSDEILTEARAAKLVAQAALSEVQEVGGSVAALARAFGTFREREFERDQLLRQLVREIREAQK